MSAIKRSDWEAPGFKAALEWGALEFDLMLSIGSFNFVLFASTFCLLGKKKAGFWPTFVGVT
jgi:hypothetical protein